MKNILVIGNGFDLAHGLKTSYKDFIEFCEVIKSIKIKYEFSNIKEAKQYINDIRDEFFDSHKSVVDFFIIDYIDEEVKDNILNFCMDNFWIDYIRDHKGIEDRWCDIEYVIGNVIESLSYISNHPGEVMETDNYRYHKNYEIINKLLVKLTKNKGNNIHTRINSLKQRFYDNLEQLTYMLEVYLEIISHEINDTKLELFTLLSIDYLISFNYTSTFMKLYNLLPLENVHFIHGEAKPNRKIEENNMVFGIGQEIKYSGLDDQYDYVEFQKYYQRIIKKTGVQYKEWLLEGLGTINASTRVFIYGHSLDYTDGDVIKDLISCKYSKLYIFYIDKNALKSLVSNLIKIFSKEEVIKFTSDGTINFLHVDDMDSVKKIIG